jgi:CAAX prenyl protease-like protein
MRLLSTPFESGRARATGDVVRPLVAVGAGMLVLVAAGRILEANGSIAAGLGRAVEGAAIHGGFVAIGFLVAVEGCAGWWRPALSVGLVLLLAFTASAVVAWGSVAFLLVPFALAGAGRRDPALGRIGALEPVGLRALLLGLASGAFLGAHLLISASLTFGYAVRVLGPGAYLAAIAYDIGVNALSAEWLFRGALFSHWWRQGGFWTAASLCTVLGVIRYLLDPALPRTVEAAAGAVFYLTLLGLAACMLRAWSGSLLPGYLAALAFFAAYRTLGVG